MGKIAKKNRGNRRTALQGQYITRYVELLESPAFRVMSQSAHRALARIELEWCHHGGDPAEISRLPVTFRDFEEYGIHRNEIAPALAELEALGLIKIVQHGRQSKGVEYRIPNVFQLQTRPELIPANHARWQCIQTVQEARAITKAARVKEISPGTETVPGSGTETVPLALRETVPLGSA